MAVSRKRMPNGKLSPTYYYRAMVDGKLFSGSTGCRTKKEAAEFEREFVSGLRQEKSAKNLIEAYHQHVTGSRRIELGEAWSRFLRKPRRKRMAEPRRKASESRWGDFLAFLADNCPAADHLADVTRAMAERYIQHIRTEGRWSKQVQFRRHGKRKTVVYEHTMKQLSPAGANDFLLTCNMVFKYLQEDAGLIENPFAHIEKLELQTEEREAFTPEELKVIGEEARDTWMYPLFLAGISTGLREGDICTLRWSEVDLRTGWITRKARKTGKEVRIPILPGLAAYVRELPRDGEYVFVDLAERYLGRSRTCIGKRVSRFLSGIGIKTSRAIEGRSRVASVKDIHSLRHTFVYLAALHGVPFPVVQSVVGHMSPEMTKRYMDHATDQAKQEQLARIPDYLGPASSAVTVVTRPSRLDGVRDALKQMTRPELEAVRALTEKLLAKA